ncbi:MAG: hypothetical protein AAFO17_11455 [Pseudomonadota bacterium]
MRVVSLCGRRTERRLDLGCDPSAAILGLSVLSGLNTGQLRAYSNITILGEFAKREAPAKPLAGPTKEPRRKSTKTQE